MLKNPRWERPGQGRESMKSTPPFQLLDWMSGVLFHRKTVSLYEIAVTTGVVDGIVSKPVPSLAVK